MAKMQTKRSAQNKTGVSNVAYDVMTILNSKLDGVAAMEMYRKTLARATTPRSCG